MSRMHLLVIVIAVATLSCGRSSESTSSPLSGTVSGSSFALAGARTTTVDGNVVLTLVNVPANCQSPVAPTDGQISIDITLPKAMLAAGSYTIGGGGVTAGVTKMTKSGSSPVTFDAIGLTNGTVNVQKVDKEVSGTLSASNERVSLNGLFNAPVCP